ncbi:prevent-host-death family protein [Desulfitobacterium sp. LBE]|uniref:Antitoxin n=2 Tax=Desulfitobacterium hafniense TaxID=49338 RepID=A0A098B6B2_DESHA|nr:MULTISPECIES: type II toxin-antitoxin system Phd/YefM family antitoxin [Desulfitobacterium]EHL04210.1 prevent-host-death family protein [Desulfitobacterium hafniense DP7]KTE92270.1 prevent-host-death protein [Desulfitobacterium hafniense]TWH59766.1 prevent-host-death family protein [Desulfitobacterium sp. LBE]CDX03416.1 Prevent-host-death protein [Desulfitobacterium hafniense]
MPTIKSSTALRNDYSKISKLCHETGEPVYVTVNGEGDLAVMSIEAFEKRERTLEIREKLLEAQIQKASGVPALNFDKAMDELEALARGSV